MKIPIREIPTAELLRLLQDVAAELAAREGGKRTEPQPKQSSTHDPVVAALLEQPNAVDAGFSLMIAARLRVGGYIRAKERERLAEIANQFPLWAARHGLPLTSSAGEWRHTSL